jgi:hypothetical protein
LTGDTGNDCGGNDQEDIVISYVSLGLICAAIIVVAISVIAWEIHVRQNSAALDRHLKRIADNQATFATPKLK